MSRTRSTEIRSYSAAGSNDDDFFVGTEGRDQFDGQGGVDTVSYKTSRGGVTVNLDKGYGYGGNASGDTYASIENAIGSHQADHLFGNSADNELTGLGGDDKIYGFAGDDTLKGGKGDDHLEGGAGADVIDGGDGNDTVSYRGSDIGVNIDLTAGTAAGMEATFDLDGNFSGGFAHGDVITNVENVIGSTDHGDVLKGDAGDNMLDGWGGHDTFIATGGNDTIIGGTGIDILDYSAWADGIYLVDGTIYKGDSGEADQISGIEGVIGTDYRDIFHGSDEDEVFVGGRGNDIFRADLGSDGYVGGADHDSVSYAYADSGVTVDLAENLTAGSYAQGDHFDGIEALIGSSYDDQLTGDDEDNVLYGSGGNDVLNGGAGDDYLSGGAGIDQIDGGAGFDTLAVDNFSDPDLQMTVDLETGTVSVAANGVSSVDETFTGIEAIETNSNGFTLIGDDGDNWFGAFGEDTIVFAAGGNDMMERRALGGELDGGTGIDTVDYLWAPLSFTDEALESGLGISVDLEAGVAMARFDSNAPVDAIDNIENVFATGFNDIIIGDNEDNVIDAGHGDDQINGGRGSDTLTGGLGADVFEFVNRQNDPDHDVITDFELGIDLIDFSDNDNYIDDFEELLDNADQVGADVVIDTGQGTVTLEGIELSALSNDNFIF